MKNRYISGKFSFHTYLLISCPLPLILNLVLLFHIWCYYLIPWVTISYLVIFFILWFTISYLNTIFFSYPGNNFYKFCCIFHTFWVCFIVLGFDFIPFHVFFTLLGFDFIRKLFDFILFDSIFIRQNLQFHTHWGRFHTRNRLIHTQIEQFIALDENSH